MGTNVSSQMVESTTEIVNNSLTEISNDIQNNVSSYSSARQAMNISWKNVKIDCGIDISQTASVSVSAMLQNTNKLASDLSNKLSAKLTETITNDLKQANKGLNLLSTNVGVSQQKTSSYLSNNIKSYDFFYINLDLP